jgi:hypothetical protein
MEATMGWLASLKGLFGGGDSAAGAAGETVEYKGYQIRPKPQRTSGGWNTAGVISKTFPDGTKSHGFIRVDTHSRQDDAIAFSVTKAQQIIDEQGDRIFDRQG